MREQPSAETEKSFLDNWLETEFNDQYESQVEILQRLGLVDLLPDSEKMGIVGIDGKEYPVPSKEDIIREIKSNPEKYETKMKQGFTQIQLTPFAVPLERLTMTLGRALVDHYKRKKLFATKEKPTDPDELLGLDINRPLEVWSGWVDPKATEGRRGADVTGECLYYPTEDYTSVRVTKADKLKEQEAFPFAGWEVKFLETSLKPSVTKFRNNDEDGLTIEDWIIKLLVHLERTNLIISESYELPGSFMIHSTLDEVVGYVQLLKSVNRVIIHKVKDNMPTHVSYPRFSCVNIISRQNT